MAKNDWNAGDTLGRSVMNQPYWLASGTVGGTGDGVNDLRVFITPGSIRYPNKPALLASGQLQSFIISPAAAGKYYTYFIRSDGSFMVSGTTTQTIPGPPRYDAEPIGTVYTGASLGTNMIGPWNQGAFGGYEQRGQMASTRPLHFTYRSYTTRANLNSGHLTAISGIAWISINDANAGQLATHLSASVTWEPSGVPAANGQLVANPAFLIGPDPILLADNSASAAFDYRIFTTPQVGLLGTLITSTITAIAPSGSYQGYSLLAAPGAGGATMFVRDVTFSAIAGLYGSNTNEAP